MGLGAILSFESTAAVANMSRANRMFMTLRTSATRLRAGMATVASGISSLAMASIPLGLALGVGARKAIQFEQKVADVGAIARATEADMKRLTDEAIRLGIETKFSASDAAGAMELLARAGFNVEQTLAAVPGVLAMAAAEGMDLAGAASITTTVLRGMQLQEADAARVADVLAEASARANTNIQMLGEGFSYAAPAASAVGLSLEETTAAMGMLANVGMQGSRSGTMLEAMLRGLKGVTDRSREALGELGVETRTSTGEFKPLSQIITEMDAALAKFSKAEQDRLLFRIMRTEGSRAFQALRSQGAPALEALTRQLEGATETTDEFGRAVGSAALMADKRMATMQGGITLLKSSLEAMSIVMWKDWLMPMTAGLKSAIDNFNQLIYTVKQLNEGADIGELRTKYGDNVVDIALGIKDAIAAIGDAWSTMRANLRQFSEWIGTTFGEANTRSVAKWVTTITLVTAALGPLSLGLKLFSAIAGGALQVVYGLASSFTALLPLLPYIAAIGAAAGLAFLVIRNDGESVSETLHRVAGALVAFANNVVLFLTTIFDPIVPALKSVLFDNIIPALSQLRDFIRMVFGDIGRLMEAVTVGSLPLWQNFAYSVRFLIQSIGNTFLQVFTGVIQVATAIWQVVIGLVSQLQPAFESLMTVVAMTVNFVGSALQFVGDTVSFVSNAVVWLINEFSWLGNVAATVLNGIMAILQPIADLVYTIGQWLFNYVYAAIVSIWSHLQPVFSVISAIGQSVWDLLKPAFEGVYEIVSGLLGAIKGIWNFIRPLVDLVGTALVGAFNAVFDVVRDILQFVKDIIDGVKWITSVGGIGSNMDEIRRKLLAQRAAAAGVGPTGETVPGRRTARPAPTAATVPVVRAVEREATRRTTQTTPPRPEDQAPVQVNAEIVNSTTAQIDGRCVSRSVSRHTAEMRERAGIDETPYQRQAAVVRNNNFAAEPSGA